jgi:hypothetical protein
MRMAAYPDYSYTSSQTGQPATTQLLLLAGGTPQTGLMVYEMSPSGSSLGMTLRTVIPLKSSAYDVALASSGFGANSQVNLQGEPFYYGPYVMWHGAQFRGMAAGQREYWKTFLEKIGLRQPGQP